MAVIKKGCAILLLIFCLERMAIARTKFELLTSFMNQNGDGGGQVLDGSGNEDSQTYAPVLFLENQITPKTNIFGNFLVDLWSSASEAVFDTTTGASGAAVIVGPTETKLKNRIDFSLGVAQKIKTWTSTLHVGYSYEFDYHSINGGVRIDKGFAQDNFLVSLDYQIYWDEVQPFDIASAAFTAWQPKRIHTLGVSASQILTPSDLILVGYSYTNQSGFLAGNGNSVDLSGTRISETMPNLRNRHAITARYIHGFTDTLAAHGDYRLYVDNWGILSHTFEPSLYLSFNDDAGLVKFFYRFYLQSASDFFQDSFSVQRNFMTSDSDLAAFQAHEGGSMISYTWNLRGLLKEIMLSGTALYYTRSHDDLNAEIFQLGFGGSF